MAEASSEPNESSTTASTPKPPRLNKETCMEVIEYMIAIAQTPNKATSSETYKTFHNKCKNEMGKKPFTTDKLYSFYLQEIAWQPKKTQFEVDTKFCLDLFATCVITMLCRELQESDINPAQLEAILEKAVPYTAGDYHFKSYVKGLQNYSQSLFDELCRKDKEIPAESACGSRLK